MITIDSPYLTTTTGSYTAAHLCEVMLEENNYAPLVVVNYGNTETLTIEATTEQIALPENWATVSAIASNNQIYTPAVDPESPQIGEFVYNPYTNTVQVYATGVVRSIQIYGTTQTIKFAPPLLPPPYPQLFTNLPLTGAIQLTRQFEQQPSAQFELELTLSKSEIQSIFAPGTELDLCGLPLRINSISIKELPRSIYPDSRCQVSVTLGGRWENYLNEPCFLRSDGGNILPNDQPFQDSECTQPTPSLGDPNFNTTVRSLLAKIHVAYTGPNLAPVPIPKGTPRDAVVNPVQLLNDRLRVANSFVRWSNTAAVEVVPINSTRVWSYQESDILGEVVTSYEAIAKTSIRRLTAIGNYNPPLPDLVNFPSVVSSPPIPQLHGELPTALAFEYPNSELSGEFNEIQSTPKESTQGQVPRYVRKPTLREERVDGDKTANIPLDGVESIQNMSLIFDIGGQTKTRSTTTTEDGATIRIIDEIWGFAATAYEMYDASITDPDTGESIGGIRGNPNEVWKCIKRTTVDYTYDLQTGYLISTSTTGYNTVRYKQETADNPETLSLQVLPADQTPGDDSDDATDPEYFLYVFIQIPVIARTSYLLKLMPGFSTTDSFEVVKVCNRDGTSTLVPLIDPDYAPPYYVESERTESVAFATTPNPENEGITAEGGIATDSNNPDVADQKYLPDLIVGEESDFESYTQVTEAVYEQELVGFDGKYPIYKNGAQISPQKFTKYIKQFKAQGQAIATALEQISIEEGTGELPVATRRPSQFTKEQPAPNPTATQSDVQQYRYFLQTAGYTNASPIQGSESFPLAKTFAEALIAAKCKLAIENWRNGFMETLQIAGNLELKEGDRFIYLCNGEFRQRVVLGTQTTQNILGTVDAVPQVTALTSLTLGLWILPNLTSSQIPIPKEAKAPGVNISVTSAINASLGSIIDWATIRSRRNP